MKRQSFIKRIIFRHRILKYLKSFLNTKNAEVSFFREIENNPSEKLTDLLNSLRKYDECYAEELNSYNEIEKKIKEHNEEIITIKTYQFKNNKKDFCDNPIGFKPSDFDADSRISEMIQKYIGVDEELKMKAEEIITLVDNYSLINEEYLLHKEYENLLVLEDKFYDSKKTKLLKEQFKRIENSLTGKELFYTFALLSQDSFCEYITKHNDKYVERHITDEIFDDINGRSLDTEQRKAVLKDETSSLIIAGAGSGKTLTICGKLKFLLSQGVLPKDVLLLSYSKKSADDLNEKARKINPEFTVGTFHRIGLRILEEKNRKKYMIDDQFNAIIESYFRDELNKDAKAMKEILRYYALFLNSNAKEEQYEMEGELYENLKTENFRTLRDTLSNISGDRDKKMTLKKEMVKSIEELELANFYFLNGIDYVYEKPYQVDVSDYEHRQYTPDFYLKDYGIYHEHYGIDKEGKASQYKGTIAKRYVEGISWKRAIHESYGTKCLETFSYEFSDGTIYDRLTALLKENGVKFHPLKTDEIRKAINSVYQEKPFKSFINLVKSFISLYKSRYHDVTAFDQLKECAFPNLYQKVRATLFLDICKHIYSYYVDYLTYEGKIDFDDMILKSKEDIKEIEGFKYKYIIVDEFQDISYSRMEFLKALVEHGDSKLFAVGDDWQAIYRFSGCDLGIFLDFAKYFGKTQISFITSTHRNSQELQDIVGPFIKKNKQQMDKTIQSEKHLDKPVKLVYFDEDKYKTFQQVLALIGKMNAHARILVLGRNNKDVEDILSDRLLLSNSFGVERNSNLVSKDYPDLELHYSTVHSSKGLEEDYTIIINADDDKLGFPNKMEDDPLLNLVLSQGDKMEYAEERRLWYVALTRTRSYCYILVNARHPSTFVREIKEKCEEVNSEFFEKVNSPLLCPRCHTGRLIIRKESAGNVFYGCSNYPYCNYTIDNIKAANQNIRCPNCGDFMVKRTGKYGDFYGCHSYPYCKFKMKITKKTNE